MTQELWMFANAQQALDAGFRGPSLRWPDNPDKRAGLASWDRDQIRGLQLSKVVVAPDYWAPPFARNDHRFDLLQELRVQLREAPMEWVDMTGFAPLK